MLKIHPNPTLIKSFPSLVKLYIIAERVILQRNHTITLSYSFTMLVLISHTKKEIPIKTVWQVTNKNFASIKHEDKKSYNKILRHCIPGS